MGLEGSLKEFGLPDIFQLFYFQKKTDFLVIKGRFDRIKILFKDGNIVAIESRKRLELNRLGKDIWSKKDCLYKTNWRNFLNSNP